MELVTTAATNNTAPEALDSIASVRRGIRGGCDPSARASNIESRSALVGRPVRRNTSAPSRNPMNVGVAMTFRSRPRSGSVEASTRSSRTLPARAAAAVATSGSISRHVEHHGAHTSTRVGTIGPRDRTLEITTPPAPCPSCRHWSGTGRWHTAGTSRRSP